MASYLSRDGGVTIDRGFEVDGSKVNAKRNNYSVVVLQDVIRQLNAARQRASQLHEGVLLYTIDMALAQANEALNEQKRISFN